MIIDAHCHVYPEKIASKAVAGTDKFYGTVAMHGGTAEELLEAGKKAGTDKFIIQSVATAPKQVTSINTFIKECVDKYDEFEGLGTLHPDSEDLEKDVQYIVSLGLHGVKLHPDIQQFAVDTGHALDIYELCTAYKLPILMHTGDYRYDFSNPDRVKNILENFKDLILVGAHFGGWSLWDTAYKTLDKYENFYVDCSSTFPFAGTEIAKGAIKAYGADRILYGSDYPMWSPITEIKAFMTLDFTDDEREKVLCKNAEKIFLNGGK